MAKKIVAVTGIKFAAGPEGFVAAGDTLDPALFTKEQLKALHDSGAITVEDDAKPEAVKVEAVEAPAAPAGPDTSAPAAEPKAATATEKAAPAKK